MQTKQDNQEDQLNPANRIHSDENRNPGTAKSLQNAEQQSAYDRDFNEMTSPENYAKNGKSAADVVNDRENEFGYQPKEGGANRPRRQSIVGKLRGGNLRKKGPIAALVALLVGGGAAFSVFLVPGLGIVHFKEMLTDKLNDQLGAVNMRTEILIGDKLKNEKAAGICTTKVNIHCKFSTSSKKHVKKFENAGFKIEADDMFGGRKRITKITFPDGGPSVSDPGELKRLLRAQPKLQTHIYRAYFPKSMSLSNKFSKSVARVFHKNGISKASTFSGDDPEGFDQQLKDNTAGQSTKDAINNTPDSDDDETNKAASEADNLTENIDTDKPLTLEEARSKMGNGVGVLGVAQTACSAYTLANLVEGGAKLYRAMQLVQFAQVLILNPADKLKAGDTTAAETEYIGNKITEPDMRKMIENPENPEEQIPNPDYGKSAMDSPIFQAFAYDDAITLPPRSAQFMIGGGLVGSVAGAIDGIERFMGGKDNARKTCRVVNSPFGTAISFLGLFIPGAGLVAALAGEIAGAAIEYLLLPLLMQQAVNLLAGQIVGPDTANVDIGDAVSAGTTQMLGSVAQQRGMMPMNAGQFNEYIAYTEGANNQMIAALKEEAKKTPFDLQNQYSFMGMFARSITPSFLSARTSAIGAFQIAPSFLSKSLATLTANASASTVIDPARMEKCTDQGYQDIGMKTDIACNPRYGLSPEELNMSNEEVVQYMIDNGQIKEDDMSGAAIEGSDYADWIKGCTDREQGYGVPMDNGLSVELDDGRACIDTTRIDYKYFRAFHFNNSLADDMELEEVPRESGGMGDSEGTGTGENSGNIRDDGWAWPGPKGTTACGFDCYGGHFGMDVNTPDRSPVYAMRDGEVILAGADPYMNVGSCPLGYLNGTQMTVVLRHTVNGQAVDTLYTHLTAGSISVKSGQKVKAGDQLGLSGNTGCSSGPHMHVGVYKPSWPAPVNAVDPTSIVGRSG